MNIYGSQSERGAAFTTEAVAERKWHRLVQINCPTTPPATAPAACYTGLSCPLQTHVLVETHD